LVFEEIKMMSYKLEWTKILPPHRRDRSCKPKLDFVTRFQILPAAVS